MCNEFLLRVIHELNSGIDTYKYIQLFLLHSCKKQMLCLQVSFKHTISCILINRQNNLISLCKLMLKLLI